MQRKESRFSQTDFWLCPCSNQLAIVVVELLQYLTAAAAVVEERYANANIYKENKTFFSPNLSSFRYYCVQYNVWIWKLLGLSGLARDAIDWEDGKDVWVALFKRNKHK